MAAKLLPDQAYLREALDYDPETGSLRWRERPIHHFRSSALRSAAWICAASNARQSGKEITCRAVSGYIVFGCGSPDIIYAHRAIWKLVTGKEPHLLDHKNRCRWDNRWENLREVSDLENSWNTGARQPGLRLKGVSLDRRYGTYAARITVRGTQITLGTFKTHEAAHAAYCAAAQEHFGEFWCPG